MVVQNRTNAALRFGYAEPLKQTHGIRVSAAYSTAINIGTDMTAVGWEVDAALLKENNTEV